MKRAILRTLLLLPPFLLLMGHTDCAHTHYSLSLKPQGEEMQRHLILQRHSGEAGQLKALEVNPEELKKLKALYPEALASKDGGQEWYFQGRWTHQSPQDIGGAGHYLRLESEMGCLSLYSERFRGHLDQAGHLRAGLQLLDQLLDLGIAWMDLELKDQPGQAQLHAFLDGPLRQDLQNLGLMAFQAIRQREQGLKSGEALAARALLYLQERGHLSPTALPKILSALHYRAERQEQALFQILRRLLARGMGIPDEQPIPKALRFLKGFKSVEAQLESHLEQHPKYQARLRAWAVSKQGPKPKAWIITEELAQRFLELEFAGSTQHIDVRLKLPLKPLRSNGRWAQEQGLLIWDEAPFKGGAAQPYLIYAVWSEVNSQAQKQLFGSIPLQGEALARYVLWRQGLSPQEAQEWGTLLKSLRADDSALNTFRFSTDPPPAKRKGVSLADFPRRLLKRSKSIEQAEP